MIKVLVTLMICRAFQSASAVRGQTGRKLKKGKKDKCWNCLSTASEIQAALTAGANSVPPKVDISICPNAKIIFSSSVETGAVPTSGPLPVSVSCCGSGCVFDGAMGKHVFVVGKNFDTYHSARLDLKDISIMNADEFFIFFNNGTSIALNNVNVVNVGKVLEGYTCPSPHCTTKPCC
jgi:hypothetical protein